MNKFYDMIMQISCLLGKMAYEIHDFTIWFLRMRYS